MTNFAREWVMPVSGIDEQLSYLAEAPDAQLAELTIDLESELAELDRKHAERTATARMIVEAGYKELGSRMLAREAKAIAHPELIVELVPPKTKLEKRPSDLEKLFSVLPAEELVDVLWRDQPPKPEEMPLQSNGTKLKALARKYGPHSEVAKIIARGMVYVDVGSYRVRMERRAKDVTPHD